jgi:ribosomal subunit interface protein
MDVSGRGTKNRRGLSKAEPRNVGATMTGEVGMVWEAEISSDVVVQTHGDVGATDRSYARMKIARIWERAAAPVLYAKVELRRSSDPARAEPAEVKAELDLDGHIVRAEAEAPTFFEAVDRLDARLRRQLARLADRDETHHRRARHTRREPVAS